MRCPPHRRTPTALNVVRDEAARRTVVRVRHHRWDRFAASVSRSLPGRSLTRYWASAGPDTAAAATYAALLTLFPAALVAISALGLATRNSTQVREGVNGLISTVIPAHSQGVLDALADTHLPGITLGAIGLALAGTSWVAALRRGLQKIVNGGAGTSVWWRTPLADLATFLLLGSTVLLSVLLMTGGQVRLPQAAGGRTLEVPAAESLLGIPTAALSIAVLAATLTILYCRIPGLQLSRVRTAGAIAATTVGLVIAKTVFGAYATLAADRVSAVYGTFAVAIGVMLWLSLVHRYILLVASVTRELPGRNTIAADNDAAANVGTDAAEQSNTEVPKTAPPAGEMAERPKARPC